MNNLLDQIDAYLDGTLSAEERAAFESKMSSDAALREQVEAQKNLRAGIERLGMKAATASTFKKITLKNKIYKWGMATVAATTVATTVYLTTTSSGATSSEGPEITYELPATNETGGTDWADADRNLPTQLFTIDPAKDTVIETMGGLIFAIPAGAFVDAKDPMTLEVREALNPFDIMQAGLSTTSNGELLETAGMFYINARSGETSLQLNPEKPISANVPTDEIRPGMQLFDGERKPDGSINWVNPKPMEKNLVPVDIFSLNFYPDGFLGKVAELGFDANDRKVTDSIYFSYAGRTSTSWTATAHGDERYPQGYGPSSGLDGKALFNANCASCHTNTDKDASGPGLKGVLSRIPGGNWQYDFVHNPALVIKSGDPYANKVDNMYGSSMTAFPVLTNEQIDAIMAYADHGGKPYGSEIDPARIAAIRTQEFQNTIIATKEFEERLQVIFRNCNPAILDLYVNNLDKKLYVIDSMAMSLFPESGGEFKTFYDRRDGGVSISQSHMTELQSYYQRKQEAVRTASQTTFEKRTAEQRKQDSVYFAQQADQSRKSAAQSSENFTSEYNTNLKEAYRQLGIQPYTPPPAADYYTVTVTTPGWKNVDAYVNEATLNRTTLDYTDPSSGKKAVIKYEPLDINISDASIYSQLMVYLVTDSLPCFMRVYPQNGKYSEKLNELMEYSLVVMAEKDGTWFSATTPKVTPGTVNVKLLSTDESSLRVQMNALFTGKIGNDLGAEITYMRNTHQYTVRKDKEKEQAKIDAAIMNVIFPCAPHLSCAEAEEIFATTVIVASDQYEVVYKKAEEEKALAYAEATRIEASYKNPLEKAAKKAAADAARTSADAAYEAAIAPAKQTFDITVDAAKKKLEASCGAGYFEFEDIVQ